MRLLRNSGNERVIDQLRDWLHPSASIDLMSPEFSLHAFAETRDLMTKSGRVRLLLGEETTLIQSLFGGMADISYRGRLQGRWLARAAYDWIKNHAEIRHAATPPPQSMIVVNGGAAQRAVLGTCAFTTEGRAGSTGLFARSIRKPKSVSRGSGRMISWNGFGNSTGPATANMRRATIPATRLPARRWVTWQ